MVSGYKERERYIYILKKKRKLHGEKNLYENGGGR